MAKRLVLLSAVLLLVVIGLLPILIMSFKSLMREGHLSFAFYQNLLTSSHEWILIRNSLILSSLTALFSAGIGLPLGILLSKTDLPFRQIFTVLFTIPLLIPPYITAISWVDFFGANGFIVHTLGISLARIASQWFFGLPGCVFVLSSTFLPIVMLLTITFLKTVNPRLEEAGKLAAGWLKILKGITIPMIFPGISLALILVFLLTLGEFGVPIFLRYQVFSVESFTQFSAFYDFGAATATAIPLIIITILVLSVERLFLREKTYQLRTANSKQFLKITLGPSRKWWLLVVGLLCFIVVVIPILVLVVKSLSLQIYIEAFSRAGDSILRSLLFAIIGASLLTIFGFLLGYLIQNRTFPFWRSIDTLTIFLFALPSTVTGIGLISLWNRPFTNFIYATPIIIILGYLAQYVALSSRIVVSTLSQIPQSMEEAAQIVGAGWIRRTGLIITPLAKQGLIASWLVAYVFCLRDTGITMMVYPPGQDTLPVRIFTLMANGSSDFIAALCVIMILITILPFGIFGMLLRRRRMI